MIQELKLKNVATYTEQVSIMPSNINFCYGSNGSGKSTLANVVSGKHVSSDCIVKWQQEALPVLVYNKTFVETNFGETIGGIFTLGEDSKEAQEFISQKRLEYAASETLINGYISSIDNLKNELIQAKEVFEETCWSIQQTYGSKFAEALVGYRRSKASFAEKCLESFSAIGESHPHDISELEELYAAAYSDIKERYELIPLLDIQGIKDQENCDLLGKHITGSVDTPVGGFIEYLQNSDWVKQGVSYAVQVKGKCPYCQQLLPENIQQDIAAFFDESYERDCARIKEFVQQYTIFMDALLATLQTIANTPIPILDYALYNAEVQNLSQMIDSNKNSLSSKVDAPANKITIMSVQDMVKKLNELITEFNNRINRNNEIVKDQNKNRMKCQSELWRFFSNELREVIGQYKKRVLGLQKGEAELGEKKREEDIKQLDTLRQIEEKEKKID